MEQKSKYSKDAGIYKLTSKISNKVYIGKAVDLSNRLAQHKNSENLKVKPGFYIRNSIIKHGWDSFTVDILEIYENFDRDKDNFKLLERESYYIDLFDSTNRTKGYNICKFSNDRTGVKCSEEHKKKISLAHLGKPKSRESVERMRLSKLGKSNGPHSMESIEKMSISKLGKKRPEFSEEWKQNIGKGHVGLVMSEEAKQKISLAHKGKPKSKESVEKMRQSLIGRKASDETKEKMSKSQKGRTHTDEVKEKLRQINTGRKMSLEARENMRKARLAYIENKKNEILC